MIVNKHYSDSQ